MSLAFAGMIDGDDFTLEAIGEGLAVRTAANGAEALDARDAVRPALILLDMRMPVLDGWEFAKRFHERRLGYPIVVMTYLGVRGIQTRLIWTAQNLGADRLTILRRVITPAVLPGIFAGMRIALPLAIVVVVVTEMIGDTQGLGYYITIWSTRFRYANVYAGILTIGLCGFVLDLMLTWWRGTVIRWEQERKRL